MLCAIGRPHCKKVMVGVLQRAPTTHGNKPRVSDLAEKILLAKSSECQSRERRRSGRSETDAGQIVDEATDVNCGGQGHRLQMGLGKAEVAGGPQFKGVHGL